MDELKLPVEITERVFTKKAFFNFYGAIEAEDLEEARVIDTACDLGGRYLLYLDDVIANSIQSLLVSVFYDYTRERMKQIKLPAETTENLKKLIATEEAYSFKKKSLMPYDLWYTGVRIPIRDLVVIVEDLPQNWKGEPYWEMVSFVPSATEDLREAFNKQDVRSMQRSIDYINGVLHMEGQMITLCAPWMPCAWTLVSASVYQPEAMQYMSPDIIMALLVRACRQKINGIDLFNRDTFITHFIRRLELLREGTGNDVVRGIREPLLSELLARQEFRNIPSIQFVLEDLKQ